MNFTYNPNRIALYGEQDKLLAEATFPDTADGTADIDHTFVDDSLQGQGITGKLMEALAGHLRAQGKKAALTCSYTVRQFEKHPEYHDLIKQSLSYKTVTHGCGTVKQDLLVPGNDAASTLPFFSIRLRKEHINGPGKGSKLTVQRPVNDQKFSCPVSLSCIITLCPLLYKPCDSESLSLLTGASCQIIAFTCHPLDILIRNTSIQNHRTPMLLAQMIPWPHAGISITPKFNPLRRAFQVNADLFLPPIYPGKYPLVTPMAYDNPDCGRIHSPLYICINRQHIQPHIPRLYQIYFYEIKHKACRRSITSTFTLHTTALA